MYTTFFRLKQAPFSIAPDPRYLFMSERHREALAHLLYGIDSGGGVVLLTGDIGTGKTTICRGFLEQVPANCNVAYIFNPKLTVRELLQAICEEFHVELAQPLHAEGVKDYIDALNRFLLQAHAAGRNNVLIIDEAQNLSAEVLEQLRLLTNLETNERKLLQIILIGQPELRTMLARPELEQLAQRVIAHTHLTALTEQETASYIQHRLTTAGLASASPFQPAHTKLIHQRTQGVPRHINLLCDRALLGAYAQGQQQVDRKTIEQAADELFIPSKAASSPGWKYAIAGILACVLAGSVAWAMRDVPALAALRQQWFAPSSASPTVRVATATQERTESSSASMLLSEHDGIFRDNLTDEADLLRQLAQLWGVTTNASDPCSALTANGLRCYRSSNGIAELRQLDRPAVIKLYDHQNRANYLLLTALDDSKATLRADGATQTLARTALTPYFRGEFVTLWHAPPGFSELLKPGASGPDVDWLAAQLAQMNKEPAPAAGEAYSLRTANRVREFQQAQGLLVDGIAGPVTLMHLNRVTGIEEPRLQRASGATPVAVAGE